MLLNILGFIGSAISFVLWLPQARLVWQNRHNPSGLSGLSAATMWLVLCNATVWGLYAAMTGAFWSGAPGLVNAPLAVAVLVLLRQARRTDDDPRTVASAHVTGLAAA